MYKREWNRRVNITLPNPLSGNKQCDEGPFYITIINLQQTKGLISEPKILLKHNMIEHESKQQIGIIIRGEACLWTINYTQFTQLRCGNGNTTAPLSHGEKNRVFI